MQEEASQEQRWLERMAGDWTYEMEAEGNPGEPPITDSGTEWGRSLGVWVQCESQGQTPDGSEVTSIMTLGYDAEKQRFVGTFISSMSAYLWSYDGELDTARNVLTLHAEGPSYTEEGKMAKYKDTIEFQGDDHRVHQSLQQLDDGSWHLFMTTHYRRVQ